MKQVRKYALFVNLKKCQFSTDKVYFLRYIMSSSGIYIEPEHIKSIKNWSKLQSIKEIQLFIGFANFYRWFIQNFNTIANLLTSILKIGPGSKACKPAKKSIITLS